jgi:hypothetical protein
MADTTFGTDVVSEHCPLSKRVDGQRHSWRFDGDDPRVVCVFCGEVRDALTGQVIQAGRASDD